ncbi:MAG: fluoride efflux transporter CrcB [Cyclobacteriaceae bacterium]
MAIQNLLFIGIGGFIGSISRYACSYYLDRYLHSIYPWGTFAVNITGCFLLGLILGLTEHHQIGERWRFFLATGFCGSFTTFSTFAAEGYGLYQKELTMISFVYLAGSVVLGILMAGAGIWVGKQI